MNDWQQNSPLAGLPFVRRNVRSQRASSRDRTGANRYFRVIDARVPGLVKQQEWPPAKMWLLAAG